mmetsp:Transcript_30624/g.61288  ORF Transcript_30624/g.61288 Transcript_30624/m.61288 type:complete len:192 (+) Transcript_30624:47-622(+)|eukprot:CAMPEP_0171913264 /NCGR_PEP_ID=MMETSP0993-20121228/11624_1 /TAXON_ID=483369 /ORGANISM="non described non described, Strain CCMP2098" /LENGTH=191 /DNA_ID=CAMNT_0012547227 /DNA_START=1 /DNA_END=576 /DNA_ORIENTATION=+
MYCLLEMFSITALLIGTMLAAPTKAFVQPHGLRLKTSYRVQLKPLRSESSSGEEPTAEKDDESTSEVDFNALFAKRVAQEGGEIGVKAKFNARKLGRTTADALEEAKRSASTTAEKVSSTVRPQVESAKEKGLLSNGDWDLTLVLLGSVVLLAFLLPFATGTAGYANAPPEVDPAVWGTNGGAGPLEFGRR